jgi:hypothetical protein
MKTLRAAAVAIVSLIALVLQMGVATADEWETDQFTGDHDSLEQVRIDHARLNVFLHTGWQGTFWPEGDVYYWLDTSRSSAGPEYRVHVYLDEFNNTGKAIPGTTIYRINGFRSGGGEELRCGARGWLSEAGDVDVTVPRSCLRFDGKLPTSVRMSVGVLFAYGGPDFNGSWAWSPGRHQFGPWVAQD